MEVEQELDKSLCISMERSEFCGATANAAAIVTSLSVGRKDNAAVVVAALLLTGLSSALGTVGMRVLHAVLLRRRAWATGIGAVSSVERAGISASELLGLSIVLAKLNPSVSAKKLLVNRS